MPIRKGMLGVALALAIVPTQSALAATDANLLDVPSMTPAQQASQADAYAQAARKLPAPASSEEVDSGEVARKLSVARAATQHKLATDPKQAADELAATVQGLKKPGGGTLASKAQSASSTSSTGGTPIWPTCYRKVGPSYACNLATFAAVGPSKGVMIIVASSAWESNLAMLAPPHAPDYWQFEPLAQAWAASGFTTYIVEHTGREALAPPYNFPSGVTATGNLVQWFDLIRWAYPTTGPTAQRVCMKGISSGGHLSLLVAANRANLSCVITEASPTNITPEGTAYSVGGPDGLEAQVAKAFGTPVQGYRSNFSPVAHQFQVAGLIPTAIDDIVHYYNAQWAANSWRPNLRDWIPAGEYVSDCIAPPGGGVPFGHSCKPNDGLSQAAANTYVWKQLVLAALGQHV